MKRIVIVDAGFAGLAAAKALRHANADVLVIDRANHNLFRRHTETCRHKQSKELLLGAAVGRDLK
jgi:NADH dehydrogenase FAD-containing subunit